ncbi:MAG: hypothetical protein AB7T22_11720 [Calditrichaceae bacterium]
MVKASRSSIKNKIRYIHTDTSARAQSQRIKSNLTSQAEADFIVPACINKNDLPSIYKETSAGGLAILDS